MPQVRIEHGVILPNVLAALLVLLLLLLGVLVLLLFLRLVSCTGDIWPMICYYLAYMHNPIPSFPQLPNHLLLWSSVESDLCLLGGPQEGHWSLLPPLPCGLGAENV